MRTILIQTRNDNQMALFMNMADELQLPYSTAELSEDDLFLNELKTAGREAVLIANNKMEGIPFETLLEELQ